jgi:hypothetical protein
MRMHTTSPGYVSNRRPSKISGGEGDTPLIPDPVVYCMQRTAPGPTRLIVITAHLRLSVNICGINFIDGLGGLGKTRGTVDRRSTGDAVRTMSARTVGGGSAVRSTVYPSFARSIVALFVLMSVSLSPGRAAGDPAQPPWEGAGYAPSPSDTSVVLAVSPRSGWVRRRPVAYQYRRLPEILRH